MSNRGMSANERELVLGFQQGFQQQRCEKLRQRVQFTEQTE